MEPGREIGEEEQGAEGNDYSFIKVNAEVANTPPLAKKEKQGREVMEEPEEKSGSVICINRSETTSRGEKGRDGAVKTISTYGENNASTRTSLRDPAIKRVGGSA